MSITKKQTTKGARWVVEWRLPGRIKRRRTFQTEREARLFQAEQLTAHSHGVYFDPRRGNAITLAHAYTSWLATRQDLTPKVRRGYEDCWRLSVSVFADWPVSKLDRASIQNYVNTMRDVGPRTQRWRHSVLKMVLDHAVSEGWIAKNPAAKTIFPPLIDQQHVYLTSAEVDALAKLCGPQGDVVTILAYTGMRFGELMGLNVEDVDLVARRIRVRRSITQVGGRLIVGAPKSKAGKRSIPIPRKLDTILRARIEGRVRTQPAIASPKGFRLGRENWVRSVDWRVRTTQIGRPTLRIHDLRHTYASLARSAGADLRLLQKTMGHASITVTAHTYADLYDGELDAVAEALDSL
ncbi:site-specific integrase [Rhodococcus sp. NPDC077669]|uniref:tyrosine-type recombinase/integrase n=1 Tax=Rhodococcus sp. NPDC077669 TaxID=3155174 RepID=UPI00343F3DCC